MEKDTRSDNRNPLNISRRNFIASTAAIAAAGIIGPTTLASCSSQDSSPTQSVEAMPEPAEETTGTWGSVLNPQEDFDGSDTDYSAIFSPLQIAHVTLRNRLAKSCAGSELQVSTDWPDEKMLAFYEGFAKGELGMIVYEQSLLFPPAPMTDAENMGSMGEVMPEGLSGFLSIYSDDGIPAHKEIADRLHQHGVVLIAQMLDTSTSTGAASSKTIENGDLEMAMVPPIMQTTEQLHQEQMAFIDAAERYKKAGWDGIELNASCNHYFSTFLSRYANNERTDEYSAASIENRARILTEIIEGIRERVGEDFIIQVLYSGIEGNVSEMGDDDLCTSVEEAIEFAKLFEKAGASSLHVRSQMYGHHNGGFQPDIFHYHEHGDTGYGTVIDYKKHFQGVIDGSHDGAGALIELAAKIKANVNIPVGTVGYMDPRTAPELMNGAIADGKIDFMLMTRPLIADGAIAKKLKEGRRDEVAPCTRCMTCFVAPFDFSTPSYCRVNPAHTRAYTDEMPEGYDPTPATDPKNIMVIGAGPAGMEAARIAAQRGHTVSLYEKSSTFGGLTNLAAKIKGPHERIADYNAYLKRQLEVTGVNAVFNQKVDLEFVKQENPDIVIVATGATDSELAVKGAGNEIVTNIETLYAELLETPDLDDFEALQGDRVVIYGAQLNACNIAEYLIKKGRNVTILNPNTEAQVYLGGPTWPRIMGKAWLRKSGVDFYHNVVVNRIDESSVNITTEYGIDMDIPCDRFVNAQSLSSNLDLYDSILAEGFLVQAVGDCSSPGVIANAVARANIVARNIENLENEGEVELAENQFAATASGIGPVQVILTVEDGAIVDASVDTSNETAGVGRDLGDSFAEQIVESGSIDAVSGATLTSNAVKEALEDCKKQAGL